tara:strand:- start:68 stop:253 length:186 start_codon:yes stop_codon:yes gene_type:complete
MFISVQSSDERSRTVQPLAKVQIHVRVWMFIAQVWQNHATKPSSRFTLFQSHCVRRDFDFV